MTTPKAAKGTEIELKLELDASGADALTASDLLANAPGPVLQHAIYFDTPDQALLNGGLSLRIRREAGKRIQTVKAAGTTAGLFVRSEWERDVADDLPVLDDDTPISGLLTDKASAIEPAFTVENERRRWNRGGIEIAFDTGRVIAGDRETPFVEIELEHKRGDPRKMFALARKINAIAPVQIGVLAKAERGYRLLGPASTAAKAHRIVLDEGMTAARALQTIGFACLRHHRLNARPVIDHGDATALHQARVAIRRLRSALAIHKSLFADAALPTLNSNLRWLAAELGKARDIDVLIKRAEDGPAKALLLEARTPAYDNAIAALQSDRARNLMIDLVEWLTVGEWLHDPVNEAACAMPVHTFAAKTLRRLRKKVKRQGLHLEDLKDEARHELRKSAKKLRYATEFFAALYEDKRDRRRHKRFLSALEGLQESLGDLNDMAAAPEILQRLGIREAISAREADGPKHKTDLLDQAAYQHETLIDAKRFWN